MQTSQNYDKGSLESVLKYLVEKYGGEILSGSVLLDFYSALKDDYSVIEIMIRNSTFKNLFALKKSGKPKNECSAGINAELTTLKESVPSEKAKKYILMAARLAGFNVRDSQTPAPPKPVTDKKLTAQQKPSANTAAPSPKPEATSLSKLETLLLPPSKTAAAPSSPPKKASPALSNNEFLKLCALKESAEVEEAIINGADPNARNNNGTTALMTAVCHGRVKSAQILLKHGADVNAKDSECKTALMFATEKGYLKSMQILISRGANINARDQQAKTALNYARENGKTEAEKLLVSYGAARLTQSRPAVRSKPPRKTAETEYLPAVYDEPASELLPEIPTDEVSEVAYADYEPEVPPEDFPDEKTQYTEMSNNDFVTLCFYSDADRVEEAIMNGADVNAKTNKGFTALMSAAKGDHAEIAELLLTYGANVNDKDITGWTALMYAAREGRTKTARVLLTHGANVNAKSYDGYTALMLAAINAHTKTAEVLLKHGANANEKDKKGKTALMLAKELGHTKVADIIISYRHTKPANKPATNRKPVPAVRNENHNTAIAVKNDRTEVNVTNQNIVNQAVINNWNVNIYFDASDIALLCEQDKEIHVRDKHGRTALHLAVCRNDTEETEYLLKCGANVNARDNNGHTALFDAAYSGHTEAARLLMQHGADVNCTYHDKDYSDGITVLHVAKLMKHYETANVILAFGGMDSHPVTTAINETVETAGKIALVAGKLATDTAGAIVDTTGNIITGTANAISETVTNLVSRFRKKS